MTITFASNPSSRPLSSEINQAEPKCPPRVGKGSSDLLCMWGAWWICLNQHVWVTKQCLKSLLLFYSIMIYQEWPAGSLVPSGTGLLQKKNDLQHYKSPMLDFISEQMQSDSPEKLLVQYWRCSEPSHLISRKVTPAFDYLQDVCSSLWFLIWILIVWGQS